MDRETPWTTCFLTRMLVLYLEAIGKDSKVDYRQILDEVNHLTRVDNPKAFLKDYNNWVPHSALKALTHAAEAAAGTKEVTYLAARHYFQSKQEPSFLEIVRKLLNNIEQALFFSNLWATGYANYLKLQCVIPSTFDRPQVTILSQFQSNVEPIIGSINFIRGNYEGFAKLFHQITDATCTEEISQLKIETIVKEFDNYEIEKRGPELIIIESRSRKEVAAARKCHLKTEAISFSSRSLSNPENLIVPPQNEIVAVLSLEKSDRPSGKEQAVYEIVREGTLQKDRLTWIFQKGQFFNAPYSRFQFRWKADHSQKLSEMTEEQSRLVSLLFNHLRELRETQKRLLWITIQNKELAEANQELQGVIQKESDFYGIIGKSSKMQRLFEQIELIAPTDSTVLIMGETGTGKELLAKAIHKSSGRKEQRFLAINCAALTESLLESELFGYEKGAFTGALSQKKGIFETAHGGTLFLDEVGEISLTMQAKLLRVLEEQEIQRVGSRETIPIDVRVLSATNRNLEELVAAGKFRSDLFYRLHVISLTIPPLRERLDDLLLLVDYYLNLFSQKCKKQKPVIDREAAALLMNYDWPGNIRQLKNVIERAVVLDRDQVITPEDIILPEDESGKKAPADRQAFHEAMDQFRRNIIEDALKKTGGNQTKAAQLLGLQRTYLARLIRVMNLSVKS